MHIDWLLPFCRVAVIFIIILRHRSSSSGCPVHEGYVGRSFLLFTDRRTGSSSVMIPLCHARQPVEEMMRWSSSSSSTEARAAVSK